jgi:hypothetical protein
MASEMVYWIILGQRWVPITITRLLLLTPMRLPQITQANCFERLTEGRARGQAHIRAHERKSIAGDWRNYFRGEVKRKFKNRFGGVLIASGYEYTLDW